MLCTEYAVLIFMFGCKKVRVHTAIHLFCHPRPMHTEAAHGEGMTVLGAFARDTNCDFLCLLQVTVLEGS